MDRVLAIAAKDLRLLLRDKAGSFFTFFFPLINALFFGYIFSVTGETPSGLKVALIDEDESAESRSFADKLRGSTEFSVEETTRDEGEQLVRKGKTAAYIVLPKGFGAAREQMFWGEGAKVLVGLDPARKTEAGMIQGLLTKHLFDGFSTMFADPARLRPQLKKWREQLATEDAPAAIELALIPFFDALENLVLNVPRSEDGAAGGAANRAAGWQPASIETVEVTRERLGPANAFEISFPQGMMWGVMACAASFGISLVIERSEGTLVRLQTAPVSRGQILAGKALACLTATLGVTIVLALIGVFGFGMQVASVPLLAMAMLCVALCFTGLMMLLSLLGKSERSAGAIGWAVLLVMAMTGGAALPLAFMPPAMQAISDLSPVKWAVLSIEGAIWRGLSFGELLKPCGILLAIGAGSFEIGRRAFRWG